MGCSPAPPWLLEGWGRSRVTPAPSQLWDALMGTPMLCAGRWGCRVLPGDLGMGPETHISETLWSPGIALHSPQPRSHLSVSPRGSVGVSRGCQGCLGCQGYPEPRAGLGFGAQFGTCWAQQSTQKGLLAAKTPLDSEIVPPFLQNSLYLEALSASKLPWQVWAPELAGLQGTHG